MPSRLWYLKLRKLPRPKLCWNFAFTQNFHTKKLGEITVFFAVTLQNETWIERLKGYALRDFELRKSWLSYSIFVSLFVLSICKFRVRFSLGLGSGSGTNFRGCQLLSLIMLPSKCENLNPCSTKLIHFCKKLPLALDCRRDKNYLQTFNIDICFQVWARFLRFLFYAISRSSRFLLYCTFICMSSKRVSQIFKILFQTCKY